MLTLLLRSALVFYVKMATLTGLKLLALRSARACRCGVGRRC